MSYIPDFYIIQLGRDKLVECKPGQFVEADESRSRFEAARIWYAEGGWDLSIVSAKELRARFCLRNLEFLTQFARHIIKPHVKERICEFPTAGANASRLNDILRAIPLHDMASAMTALLHNVFLYCLFLRFDEAPISWHITSRQASYARRKNGI